MGGVSARRRPSHERAAHLAEVRAAVVLGPVTYPEELPVSARREEIAAAVAAHQVVVVSGETGSGKTTQLPKICLELGRGRAGQIGHTQPRRIAARAVAERVAAELGTPLGLAVGYQVRFTDTSSDATLVKVMTDGILLASVQRDPLLEAYDTIIIDEAHERSLNIDFLLGYLTNLLPRRPDLKVIITSATIDSQKFAAHFGTTGPRGRVPAPVVQVTGRTYPVQVRYRPLAPEPASDDPDEPVPTQRGTGPRRRRAGQAPERDLMTGICEAVDELVAEGPGDILVFTSGEREIRDATDALRASLGPRVTDPRHPGAVELVPLYARLSAGEQHRVFEPHTTRRVVLATNVAETSLTVPGVRYVVDPGTARISRYSKTTKVQRLPIEPVSKASADQRSGRCGRVADGVAVRLYSADDYASRPAFTEPEILRTSLAAVILQMIAVGVVATPEEVARFAFVDPPDVRAVRDGVALLTELGALSVGPEGGLTEVGRTLARLPVDPRLGRMIVEAGRRQVAREVVVIAAALSVHDPRERPADERQAADAMHRRFVDPTSDLLGYLNLWTWLREQRRGLSGSALRRTLRAQYLHHLRIREWQDVVAQLRELCAELGIDAKGAPRPAPDPAPAQAATRGGRRGGRNTPTEPGSTDAPAQRTTWAWDADAIHRSVLAGLLSQVGMQQVTDVRATKSGEARARQRTEYLGARGARFALWPASALAKHPTTWVMAAELVETSRLWARDVAQIRPEWAEEAGAHLVRRVHTDPGWSRRAGAATVTEKVFLFGVPLVADRRVPLARTDPGLARELFIRHGLVEGERTTHHRFWAENQRLLAEAEGLAARTRRRDLLADDQSLVDFYDERLPDDIVSARHFDRWWKTASRDHPDLLTFTRELLVGPEGHEVDTAAFPTVWPAGDARLAVTYHFDPGGAADGVAVLVPIAVLPRLDPDSFTWLVPGLRRELVTATIRSLPKPVRVALVPAPDTAADVTAWLDDHGTDGAFRTAFAQAVMAVRGVVVPDEAFDDDTLPAHLRMTFCVVSDAGAVLAQGKDLRVVQRELAGQAQDAVSQAVRAAVRTAVDEASPAAMARPRVTDRPGPAGPGPGAGLEQTGLTSWPRLDGPLPAQVSVDTPVGPVRGYPALVDDGGTVALRVLADERRAASSHRDGLCRLLVADVGLPTTR
ncbi:MAG: ATP-dependent RNA helicase HrpA, partial [Micrococcales bacterium]|nr:ATP-dependent RNA helicase HrpA [Micrococcales bacterium]